MLNSRHIGLFLVLFLASTLEIFATNEPIRPLPGRSVYSDKSVMDFDVEGPYVFYRRKKMTVKYLNRKSSGYEVIEEVIEENNKLPVLTCPVNSEAGHSFEVQIRNHHPIPPAKYKQPKKLFAISDIEGEFHAFVASLIGNGVIDKDYNWTYGKGHLVLVGDFFDRGEDVTACLWLIYKLEGEAAEAGGMVHFIIGNHEEMNMRGDVRYVRAKYKLVAKKFGVKHRMLYGANTELGRWLRSKNVIERIGRTIFVHGGLSETLANARMPLSQINDIARQYFGKDKFDIRRGSYFADLIFGKKGPMWYRGYFQPDYKIETLDPILQLYGADQVVVGHTVVSDVSTLLDGRIYAIDVKHEMQVPTGGNTALVIENNKFYKVNSNGSRASVLPIPNNNVVTEIPQMSVN